MTNSPLHLMLRTFKLQIPRNFSYCCGLNELMPSAVALTFIWRGKFWATCNRIVQLDDEQNDNDRLMWQKIEWGKFANENSEANKVHSPLFRYDDGFHYYYFMAGNHNCSYAGVLHHAYKCREEKKKTHSMCREWVDAFAEIVACVSHNFWSHACLHVNRNEYTELSHKKKRHDCNLVLALTASHSPCSFTKRLPFLCCMFFFFFFSVDFRPLGAHGR